MAGRYTKEEIRSAVCESLIQPNSTHDKCEQFESLVIRVNFILSKSSKGESRNSQGMPDAKLTPDDKNMIREVFWDLFRQGIVTLGVDDANREFPFFSVTERGLEILQSEGEYFLYDDNEYIERIQQIDPSLNATTERFLREATQAYAMGCNLASTVMLGVAAENEFNLLLEVIRESEIAGDKFKRVFAARNSLEKLDKFRRIIENNKQDIPYEVRESLDTNLIGIADIIRTFRNESGHPSGKIISREQVYVLLRLFVSHIRQIKQLRDFYEGNG